MVMAQGKLIWLPCQFHRLVLAKINEPRCHYFHYAPVGVLFQCGSKWSQGLPHSVISICSVSVRRRNRLSVQSNSFSIYRPNYGSRDSLLYTCHNTSGPLNSVVPLLPYAGSKRSLSLCCPLLQSRPDIHRACWKCGRNTSALTELFFCHCGIVQKPDCKFSYFELMQMEPGFDIDTRHLGEVFREMQKKLHPDKFSIKTQEERDLAHQQSSLLNKAYGTLLKPISRAIYLLQLQGIEISEKDTFTEPEVLEEIMDINEQISSAQETGNVQALQATCEAKMAACVAKISAHYRENKWEEMKRATILLRYYTTVQDRIQELERKFMG